MANSLTGFNPEYWSKRMQIIRHKESVYKAIGNMEERAQLKNGDTAHRPYRSRMRVQTYTKGTAVTPQDVTATDESLVVDQTRIVPFYVDDVDQLQNKWDTVNAFADDAGREIETYIDGQFLGEVTNADLDVDDGDIGGTDGSAAVISVSNITKLFAAAAKKLDRNNISRKNRFAVIGPTVHQTLVEKLDGKDSALGDTSGMNGHVGKYMGFELYLSNNLYYTARWTPANDPSNGATITINGATLTFATTPSSAGDVDISGTVGGTLDNLVACINDSGTPGASTYTEMSDEQKRLLTGCTAVDGATYLEIQFKGGGEVTVASSESADPWSVQTSYCMFGQKGAVDIVIQKAPSVVFKEVPDKLGKNVLPWALYGIKTFDEGDAQMVEVNIDASSY